MGPARTLFWFHPSRFGLGGMISTSLRTFQPRVFMMGSTCFAALSSSARASSRRGSSLLPAPGCFCSTCISPNCTSPQLSLSPPSPPPPAPPPAILSSGHAAPLLLSLPALLS